MHSTKGNSSSDEADWLPNWQEPISGRKSKRRGHAHSSNSSEVGPIMGPVVDSDDEMEGGRYEREGGDW